MVALVLQRMLTHRGGERKPFRAELIFWPVIITLTNVQLLIFKALVSWKPSLTWDPFRRRDPGVGFKSGQLKRGLGRVHVPGRYRFLLHSLSLQSVVLPSQNCCSQLQTHYPDGRGPFHCNCLYVSTHLNVSCAPKYVFVSRKCGLIIFFLIFLITI